MKSFPKYLAKLFLSGIILAVVLRFVDIQNVTQRLFDLDALWVIIAVISLSTQTVLMSLRWKWVANALGLHLRLRTAICEYYLATFVNQTLPGGIIGDAARAYRSRENGSGGLEAPIHAVIIERLAGQIVMFAILAGSVTWSICFGDIDWPSLAGIFVVGTIVIGLCVVRLLWRRPAAPKFLLSLNRSLWSPSQRARHIWLGIVIACLNILGFYACARATGTYLPTEAVFALIPLILTAMLVPISVGGWGWREGAAAGLFPLVGASSEAGVAAGVAFGVLLLVCSVPGLPALFLRSPHRNQAFPGA